MPHNVALITTIVAALGAALALGFLAARLKLPVLIGYLAAGIVIGPFTPGFVADRRSVGSARRDRRHAADVRCRTAFFHRRAARGAQDRYPRGDRADRRCDIAWHRRYQSLGLESRRGARVRTGAVGREYGCAAQSLESRGILETVNGHIAVGWLVVEDLVTVLVLVLLPPLSLWLGGSGRDQVGGQELLTILALTLGKVALFVGFMVIGGRRIIPWITWHIARVGPRELFTLCVIAVAVGIAYGAAVLFGVSFALGAFFAGMVMRESPLSHRAAEESLPFRDAFSVLFFVSVGMLFDPQVLVHEPYHVMAVVAIIVIGKSLAAFVLVLLFRYPLNTALTVSAGLAQIGEFSFILGQLGLSLGILPEEARSLILAGAIISIAVNPLVFHAIEPLQAWIRAKSKRAQLFETPRRSARDAAHDDRPEATHRPCRSRRLWPRWAAHRR